MLTPEETEQIAITANLLPIADGQEWKPGLDLAQGTIASHNNRNYLVRQSHISQVIDRLCETILALTNDVVMSITVRKWLRLI